MVEWWRGGGTAMGCELAGFFGLPGRYGVWLCGVATDKSVCWRMRKIAGSVEANDVQSKG